jgi:hypothetical protein
MAWIVGTTGGLDWTALGTVGLAHAVSVAAVAIVEIQVRQAFKPGFLSRCPSHTRREACISAGALI